MRKLKNQRFKFSKKNHLLTEESYHHLFSEGRRRNHPYLWILFRENQLSYPRLGFRISKKNVKRATARNRVKRVTREKFRLHSCQLKGLDILMIAKKGIHSLSNAELTQVLNELWQGL